jgi:hypothetical protein
MPRGGEVGEGPDVVSGGGGYGGGGSGRQHRPRAGGGGRRTAGVRQGIGEATRWGPGKVPDDRGQMCLNRLKS